MSTKNNSHVSKSLPVSYNRDEYVPQLSRSMLNGTKIRSGPSVVAKNKPSLPPQLYCRQLPKQQSSSQMRE